MAKSKLDQKKELSESLTDLEKEKNISKDTMIDVIESVLKNAYRSNFKEENCLVEINKDTYEANMYALKSVVEKPENDVLEISIDECRKLNINDAQIGDTVQIKIDPKSLGRISITNAKNQISQRFNDAQRQVIYEEFACKKGLCVSGKVGRTLGKNIAINLGQTDAILPENEQIKGERLNFGQFVKVYVVDVTMTQKGPKIVVSRTHKELVRGLFTEQVTEIQDNIVEIKSISREAGSRSKIAVFSNDPGVDPIGACVGMNGERVDNVVLGLGGEKIDIVNYDENPAYFIENALSPSKVIYVAADPDEKEALVVVPDYQLSLAIGKEGQNARLAARLTGYKIDIKSEKQAKEEGDLPDDFYEDYFNEDYVDEYEGAYDPITKQPLNESQDDLEEMEDGEIEQESIEDEE